jgi:phosphotransferase system HPr (HPr) family protein
MAADDPMTQRPLQQDFVLANDIGLHARPAALLVQTAARFDARVRVLCRGKSADARSLFSLLALGAGRGSTITIQADGREAEAALAAIAALIGRGFAEGA